MGLYEREVRFYSDVAPGLRGPSGGGNWTNRAVLSPRVRPGDRRVRPRARGCHTRGRRRRDPRRHSRTGHARADPAGTVHGPLLADASLAGAEWLNRESLVNQGLFAALYAGFVRPLPRPDRARAPRRVRAPRRDVRRLPGRRRRQSGRTAGPGPRRLPPGQHAVRRGRRRPAADRRRLADRHVGSGDDGCVVLPRRRAARCSAAATTTTSCCAPTTTRWDPTRR